jgi:hypothetical protein
MIIQGFKERKVMTKRQVLELVHERYSAGITSVCLNAFALSRDHALQISRSLPQDDTPLTVPRKHLEAYIEHMKSIVARKFSVFNIDEVGSSDWEDRKPRQFIACRIISPDDIWHPVSGQYQHLTLLACVSSGEDILTPMVLTSSPIRGDRGCPLMLDSNMLAIV